MVSLAHVLGMAVVAEGVETEKAFLTCKAIGCDLAQGYFIAKPTVETAQLLEAYEMVGEVNRRDRRSRRGDEKLVRVEVDPDRNLPQDHPWIAALNEMHRTFGDKNLVVIGLFPDDGDPFWLVTPGIGTRSKLPSTEAKERATPTRPPTYPRGKNASMRPRPYWLFRRGRGMKPCTPARNSPVPVVVSMLP